MLELEPGASIAVPVAAGEREIALVVGGVDVTALAERTASGIVYRPGLVELPAGSTDVVLYRRDSGRWTELRRLTAIIRQAADSGRLSADKSATVGNNGQLVQRQSATFPASGRRTFQDFTLNAGLRSNVRGSGWALGTQSNYMGVTRREQALRFSTRGQRAPMLDLSDYAVSLDASALNASLGHVSFGDSRHLANSFAARGAALSLHHGGTSLRLGALNGSPQVGWSNIVGLERASDRVFGAAIGHEMIAARPGALRFDLTVLDGEKPPVAGFTQSAVVDAEKSRGGSVQVTAALPNDRVRITSGYTRSRFENPLNDAQLRSDSSFRRPAPATRGARFLDATSALLQNTRMPVLGTTSLTVGFHDERVDPLYGSVAAQVQADRLRDAADANFSVGGLTGQVSQTWGRDNLAHIVSVLTTDDRATVANLALPVATIMHVSGRGAEWLPTFTLARNRTHQFADGLPVNGQFRPVDLPDQMSTNDDGAAAWQSGALRLTLHANRSFQDNRQPGRELADFTSGVNELSLGRSVGPRGDLSIDVGSEYQTSRERRETTRTRRLRLNSSLTPGVGPGLVASVSLVRTSPPTGAASLNTEERLELSQSLRFLPGGGAAERGQAFVRYARTTTRLAPPGALLATASPLDLSLRQQWSLSSGLNLRVF